MMEQKRSCGLPREDTGYVMQLQNFSVNDGEGIRTTVFLCGCPAGQRAGDQGGEKGSRSLWWQPA